jgi:CheY-like chemotaxis protein
MSSDRYRILCADDHDDTCFLLSTLLNSWGYEVRSAGSVEETLTIAGMEHFDLFILDYYYRDGSGVDLCRQLRRMKPQTPVMFYSGAAYESDKEQALGAGAEAYLVKPELESLLTAIQGVLQRQKLGVNSQV